MADEKYTLEENPTYKDDDIRKIQTNDDVHADNVVNPLILRILNNIKAVFKALGGKADKVTGKGLSTNDYTTADKDKVNVLSNLSLTVNEQFEYWSNFESVTIPNGKYGATVADCWNVDTNSANSVICEHTSRGIKIICGTTTISPIIFVLRQTRNIPRQAQGQTATLQIRARASKTISILNKNITTSWSTITVTNTISSDANGILATTGNITLSPNDWIEFEFIRSEMGTVVTPILPQVTPFIPLRTTINISNTGKDTTGDGTEVKPYKTLMYVLNMLTDTKYNGANITIRLRVGETFDLPLTGFISLYHLSRLEIRTSTSLQKATLNITQNGSNPTIASNVLLFLDLNINISNTLPQNAYTAISYAFRLGYIRSVINSTNGGKLALCQQGDTCFLSISETTIKGQILMVTGGTPKVGSVFCLFVQSSKEADVAIVPNVKSFGDMIKIGDWYTTGTMPYESNPNLLDNNNFSVWQRGEEFETRSYTADHWFNSQTQSVINVKKLSPNGIRLTVKAVTDGVNGTNFFQLIENEKQYEGKTLTFSVTYRSTSQFRVAYIGYVANGKSYFEIVPTINDGALHTAIVVKTLPQGLSWLECGIGHSRALKASDIGSYMELYTTKLELGSVATPYTPPNPTINLMQCQRYYIRLSNLHSVVASAMAGTSTTLFFMMPLPTTGISGRGTISFSGLYIVSQGKFGSSSVMVPPDSTFDILRNDNGISGSITSSQFNFTAGEPMLLQLRGAGSYFDFNNEIY